MITVTAAEAISRLNELLKDASKEPVVITSEDRPTHVMLDYETYLGMNREIPRLKEKVDLSERAKHVLEDMDALCAMSPNAPALTLAQMSREKAYE